jgi:hypothetical protein
MATERITPARRWEAVTPGSALSGKARSLWIGAAGTINVTELDGTDHDAMPALAGAFPFEVSAVRAGGTATDIWAVMYD